MSPEISVRLFEYDRRFGQYGSDFTYYDYNQPLNFPLHLKHSFKVVVADPPYLVSKNDRSIGFFFPILIFQFYFLQSEECLQKVSETLSFLSQPEESYMLLLTGRPKLSMDDLIFRMIWNSKMQGMCRGRELQSYWTYAPVVSDLNIPASSVMSSDCSQTTTPKIDWVVGNH